MCLAVGVHIVEADHFLQHGICRAVSATDVAMLVAARAPMTLPGTHAFENISCVPIRLVIGPLSLYSAGVAIAARRDEE
jgi:hypothetical protein